MKAILLIEVDTNVPLDMLKGENMSIEVSANGMLWKPKIGQLQVMQVTEEAIEPMEKALNVYPSGTEMHMGMQMGGDF